MRYVNNLSFPFVVFKLLRNVYFHIVYCWLLNRNFNRRFLYLNQNQNAYHRIFKTPIYLALQ